jgi:hypothetical protein
VGDDKVAGVPFRHRFAFSDKESRQVRAKSAREFEQIRELIVASKADDGATDYSQKLAEYNAILDALLPLPDSEQDATTTEPLSCSGQQISAHFSGLDYDLSDFEIEPTKKYRVPHEMIRRGKFSIEIEHLPRLLAFNHQPSAESAQKLAQYDAILAKLLPPASAKPETISTERPNALGKDLSEHFVRLGYDLSQYQIEPTKIYYVPPELLDGSAIRIEIQDLPRLIAYND